jgi:hypothetical protein
MRDTLLLRARMRGARVGPALAALLVLSLSPVALAGGEVVSNPPAGNSPTPKTDPETNVPQGTKPTVGTPSTAPETVGTPAPTATPPGADTSTAAPGGQAESTRNGALGTTGANVPDRHHGPKKPTHQHNPADGSPPGDTPPN